MVSTLDISQTIEEFPFGTSTADLVFITIDEDAWDKRRVKLGIDTAILSMHRLEVFLELLKTGGAKRRNFIADFDDKDKAVEGLEWLEDKGFIFEKNGYVQVKSSLERHVTSAAVQVYSDDWKETFRRAYRCHKFAEYRFAAIPESEFNSVIEESDIFENLEVGLISVSPDTKKTEFKYVPDKTKTISAVDSWRINEQDAFIRMEEEDVAPR